MTKPHTYQKWSTARTWPGGGWGEAMAQIRKDQHLTQRDVAEYLEVSLATVRKWEDGTSLPDRLLWPKLGEAMGVAVPDPRVPEHTPAERELIDTMLLLIDEVRLLREQMADSQAAVVAAPAEGGEPKLLNVEGAATYLGVSVRMIRNLVAERRLVHYKVGRRVMFRAADLDRFVDDSKREGPSYEAWQLRGRKGQSPRRSAKR